MLLVKNLNAIDLVSVQLFILLYLLFKLLNELVHVVLLVVVLVLEGQKMLI